MDKDILWFAENICGLNLTENQKEILTAVQNSKDRGQKIFLSYGRTWGIGLLKNTFIAYENWLKDQKIANLKDKLAESNEYKELLLEEKAGYIDIISGYADKCKELGQQLTETDKLMQEYLSKCLSLEQQLEQKTSFGKFKSAEELLKAYQNLEREFTKSRQQLAEKEKYTYTGKEVGEIEQNYESQIAEKDQVIESLQEINQSLGQTCNNDAKEIERLREKLANTTVFASKISNNAELVLQIIEYDKAGIDYLKQKQNQTAIEELEKVKLKVRDVSGALALCEIEVQIDQQIKELKGEK